MRPRIRIIALAALCAAVALAGLASVPQASGETTQTRRLFENLGGPGVSWSAPDGCTFTNTNINFAQVTMLPPQGEDTPYFMQVSADVGRFDVCAPGGPFSVVASGLLTFDSFTIESDLSSAHGMAHGTLTNRVDGSSVEVSVDVSFALSGRTYTRGSSFQCDGDAAPRCEIISTHGDGTFSGVVSVDGSNYLPGENATVYSNQADLDSWVLVNWPCFPCD